MRLGLVRCQPALLAYNGFCATSCGLRILCAVRMQLSVCS